LGGLDFGDSIEFGHFSAILGFHNKNGFIWGFEPGTPNYVNAPYPFN